mgnify:CR=1 FL=1
MDPAESLITPIFPSGGVLLNCAAARGDLELETNHPRSASDLRAPSFCGSRAEFEYLIGSDVPQRE